MHQMFHPGTTVNTYTVPLILHVFLWYVSSTCVRAERVLARLWNPLNILVTYEPSLKFWKIHVITFVTILSWLFVCIACLINKSAHLSVLYPSENPAKILRVKVWIQTSMKTIAKIFSDFISWDFYTKKKICWLSSRVKEKQTSFLFPFFFSLLRKGLKYKTANIIVHKFFKMGDNQKLPQNLHTFHTIHILTNWILQKKTFKFFSWLPVIMNVLRNLPHLKVMDGQWAAWFPMSVFHLGRKWNYATYFSLLTLIKNLVHKRCLPNP